MDQFRWCQDHSSDAGPDAWSNQASNSGIQNPQPRSENIHMWRAVLRCIYLAPHMGLVLYLSICINIYLSIYLSIHPSIYLIYLSLSLYLSLSISIYLYFYLSLSIYIYLKPFFPGSKKQSQEKGFGTPINFETPIQGKYLFIINYIDQNPV